MARLFFLEPVFSEQIWGGQTLRSKYHFPLPDQKKKYGEAWLIAGFTEKYHSTIKGHKITLATLFRQHPAWFGYTTHDKYPLLSKIITSNDWLSIQVHPNHAYAWKNEKDNGKPECWYVLDATPGAKIVLGHMQKSKTALAQAVKTHAWKNVLRYQTVQRHDFIYIPPGLVHSLGPGIDVFELQIASDITYRLYDFDRVDRTGRKRLLHTKKALDVISVPDQSQDIIITSAYTKELLVANENFTLLNVNTLHQPPSFVHHFKMHKYALNKFMQITVIRGCLHILNYSVTPGQSVLVVDINDKEIIFAGQFQAFVSSSFFQHQWK